MNETVQQAAARLSAPMLAKGYEKSALHQYRNEAGELVYGKIRLKHPNGDKWIRPIRLNGHGWELKEPKFEHGRKPLYNLHLLKESAGKVVWITEGELKADKLVKLGLVATTSGGASSADGYDWTPLKGRAIVIWPDNDVAGRSYAGDVARILHVLGCEVSVLDVDALGLAEKQDAVDWLHLRPQSTLADVEALPRIVAAKIAISLGMAEERAGYPVDALGPVLGAAAKAIAQGAQTDVAIAGQSLLAVAALLAQSRADTWTLSGPKPLALYCLTIAESGDGKSTADSAAMRALRTYDRKVWGEYDRQRREFEQAKRQPKDGEVLTPPRCASPLLKDVTVEGLARAFKEGAPSQGLFNDEAGVMFGGHGFTQDNRLKTVAALSQLWERGEFDRARAGEGRDRQFGKRLSCHLMIQPAAVAASLNDPLLSRQGFWPRFLLAWPEPSKPRQARPFEPDRDPEIRRFWQQCQWFLDHPVGPGVDGGLEPYALAFSARATEAISRFFESVERGTQGQYGDDLKPFARRLTEQACRIAAVLTLFDDPDALVVGPEAVERAVAVSMYSLEAWRSAFDEKEEAANAEYANRLHAYLQRHPAGVSEPALLQVGPKPRSRSLRDAALALLETNGRATVQGGRWLAL